MPTCMCWQLRSGGESTRLEAGPSPIISNFVAKFIAHTAWRTGACSAVGAERQRFPVVLKDPQPALSLTTWLPSSWMSPSTCTASTTQQTRCAAFRAASSRKHTVCFAHETHNNVFSRFSKAASCDETDLLAQVPTAVESLAARALTAAARALLAAAPRAPAPGPAPATESKPLLLCTSACGKVCVQEHEVERSVAPEALTCVLLDAGCCCCRLPSSPRVPLFLL